VEKGFKQSGETFGAVWHVIGAEGVLHKAIEQESAP
jgi:hypothetical protein